MQPYTMRNAEEDCGISHYAKDYEMRSLSKFSDCEQLYDNSSAWVYHPYLFLKKVSK